MDVGDIEDVRFTAEQAKRVVKGVARDADDLNYGLVMAAIYRGLREAARTQRGVLDYEYYVPIMLPGSSLMDNLLIARQAELTLRDHDGYIVSREGALLRIRSAPPRSPPRPPLPRPQAPAKKPALSKKPRSKIVRI